MCVSDGHAVNILGRTHDDIKAELLSAVLYPCVFAAFSGSSGVAENAFYFSVISGIPGGKGKAVCDKRSYRNDALENISAGNTVVFLKHIVPFLIMS